MGSRMTGSTAARGNWHGTGLPGSSPRAMTAELLLKHRRGGESRKTGDQSRWPRTGGELREPQGGEEQPQHPSLRMNMPRRTREKPEACCRSVDLSPAKRIMEGSRQRGGAKSGDARRKEGAKVPPTLAPIMTCPELAGEEHAYIHKPMARMWPRCSRRRRRPYRTGTQGYREADSCSAPPAVFPEAGPAATPSPCGGSRRSPGPWMHHAVCAG